MRALGAACLAVLAWLPAVAAEDGQSGPPGIDAVQVLTRMATAMSRVEYEGTLVYLHGHHLTTLHIAHRIDGGESRESLLALNGPIRALARDRKGVTCVLPDAHPISVKRDAAEQGVLRRAAPDPEQLAPHYLIHPLGQSRVAGRDTDVIGIIPRDNLRYGYRYYVDQATGLPLKTDLMDRGAAPIEQVMFTDLKVLGTGGPPTDAAAMPAVPPAAVADAAADGAAGWAFEALPPGFRVVEGRAASADQPEHLLISDGLAAVSVYIEPDTGNGLRGRTRMGAVNAAGRQLGGHQVTAVGEVPAETIDAIVSALRRMP